MIIIASVYGVTIDEIIVRDVIEVEYENEEAKSAWIENAHWFTG